MLLSKVNTLKLSDPGYPEPLRNIAGIPKRLFFVGTPPSDWIGQPCVAVVGSRKASGYGRSVTETITGQLASHGVVIISGLALGIDSVAHRAALARGGRTVAVLPTSLDNIYPSSHLSLAREIIENRGTIVSEYPAGSEAYKLNFVARNRIVSGLSRILLITEAAVNSGTMHTARFALDQGKTVMAVPGNINQPGSEGCNNLIKSGAVPVTDAGDVLFALGISPGESSKRGYPKGLSDAQKDLLDLIAEGVADQEALALASGLRGGEIGAALTGLEISGAVRPMGAGHWTLA